MTVQLAPPIVFQSFLSSGAPNAFGTVATYIAGTTTPQATYIDSTQTTQNLNPTPLNALGQASIWLATNLTYKIVVFDALGNQINFQDQIVGGFNLTQISIGQLLYPKSAAEIAASATIVQAWYPYGVIDRYGVNTTPGTTDMTTAVTAAIAQSVLAGGSPVQGLSTYLTSSSIPNLHTAPKIPSPAILTRSGVSFPLFPTASQTNTLNVATTGNDSNDGLGTAQPFLSLQAAINAVVTYGPVLNGKWTISMAAGTYGGTNASSTFPNGVQSVNNVLITGPSGSLPFVPTCIIDGSTATNGTWGLVSNGNNFIQVNHILFQNWTNGNGATQWGATVSQQFSLIYWNNVYTLNCDWEQKSQQGRSYITGGVFRGGFNGSTSISGDTHTYGYLATLTAPANVAVTGASGTGTVATITFGAQASAPIVGGWIVIRSINPSGYNGVYQVTASTTTSASYANTTVTAYVSGGNFSYNHGCVGYGPLFVDKALQGVLFQECAEGHVDFATFDSCAFGADIVVGSRLNGNFTNFLNCATAGYRARMAGNFNNNGCVFANNGTQELKYSYSCEFARQGQFSSITVQPIDTVAATPLTGSVALTTLKTYASWLPASYFTDSTKTISIRGAGKITGVAGNKTIQIATSLGTLGTFVIPITWGGAGATPFEFEFLLMARSAANSQDFHGKLWVDQSTGNPGGVVVINGSLSLGFAAGAVQTLTISGQLGNAGDTLALNMVEPGWETG